MAASGARILSWEEIEPAARRAFSVWHRHPEIRWAQEAWEILIRAGLASYTNEYERTLVALRFISLCDLYLDFCYMASGEEQSSEYADWCDSLDLSPLRIGQLLAMDPDLADEPNHTRALEMAVDALSRQQRERVFETLRDTYGDTSMLFLALWRSMTGPREELDDGELHRWEDDDEVLNDVTAAKAMVFEWLSEGGYPCR